jgi:hypothetical protein
VVGSVLLEDLVPVCFYQLFRPKVTIVRDGCWDCSKCEYDSELVWKCLCYKPIDKVEPEYNLKKE